MYDLNNYGLNEDYDYHEICIDSRDTTQAYSSTSTNLNWPKITLGKPLTNVVAMKVLQVVVPKTYYTFTPENNVFIQYRHRTDMAQRWILQTPSPTIPPGNYNQNELLNVLNSIIPYTQPIVTTSNITMKTTYPFNIVLGASNALMFNFLNPTQTFTEIQNNARNNPRLILGFEGGAGTPNIPPFTTFSSGTSGIVVARSSQMVGGTGFTKTIVSPFVDEINGPPYLYLNSETFGTMVHTYVNGIGHLNPVGTGNDGPQIAQISTDNVERGENIIYSDPDPQKWFTLGNSEFPNSFDFYLTAGVAEQTRALDLNGASFMVKLGILTKKNDNVNIFPSSSTTRRVTTQISAKG